MSDELKKLHEELKEAITHMRKDNDTALDLKANKKDVDMLLEKRINAANDRVDEIQSAMDDLLKKQGRLAAAATGDDETKEAQEYKSAFVGEYMRKGREDGLEVKEMFAGSDPDGGYMIPEATVRKVIEKVFKTTPMRQICNIETTSLDRYPYLLDQEEANLGGYVDERDERTGNTGTPKLGTGYIDLHEVYAEPWVTQRLLDDEQFGLESWLTRKIAERYARFENDEFVNGDTKIRGFLSYPAVVTADATRAWGSLQYIASGGAGDWAASSPIDSLLKLVYSLSEEYESNATFLIRRELQGELRKLKNSTTDEYLWQPAIMAGQPATLLSYGITSAPNMPTKAANSFSIAFGDFKAGYTIVDRLGITMIRDALTKKGWVKFYSRKRTGGGVVDFNAIKLFKFAAS